MTVNSPVSGDRISGIPCAFRGCRGYFYPASGDTGVVLCAPWGLEEAAARAAWRALADAIALAGYPCLRFDYPGTGDSLGTMAGLADAAAWTRAAGDAVGFLRAYTGVSRFILAGHSLGAALALDAAAEHPNITGLVLISPATSGAAYLRHLQSMAGTCDATGALDIAGHGLGAAMIASLARIEPLKRRIAGLTGAVVFDRPGRKAGAEVSEHLRRLGVSSALRILPSGSRSPGLAPVDEIIGALKDLHPIQGGTGPLRLPPLPATLRAALFREEPLTWTGGGGLLCRPSGPSHDGPPQDASVLVLLDAGFSPRLGWGRMAVDLTRALAASGHSALRLDVSDLDAAAVADTLAQAALALRARGLRKIIIAATGAEASVALRAARDICVAEVIAIDPAGLIPDVELGAMPSRLGRLGEKLRGAPSSGAARRHDGERIVFYQELIELAGQPRRPRWLNGLRRAAAAIRAAIMNRMPDFVRITLLQDTGLQEIRALFATLAARGTKVSLVYSGEPGAWRELAYWGGSPGNAACRVSLLPGEAQDPAAPEAVSWLLDHFIESAREIEKLETADETQAAA